MARSTSAQTAVTHPVQPGVGDKTRPYADLRSALENDPTSRAEGIVRPLAVGALDDFAGKFTREEIEAIVVAKLMLELHEKNGEPLTIEETDKALRLARIWAQTEQVFGNSDKAGRWLRAPSRALSGQTPISLLTTETGAERVSEFLYQIAYGMFI